MSAHIVNSKHTNNYYIMNFYIMPLNKEKIMNVLIVETYVYSEYTGWLKKLYIFQHTIPSEPFKIK